MNDSNNKYKLVDVGDKHLGNRKVYRIKALRDFASVKKGEIGGFVENEDNLSHSGDCWIYDDAYVTDKARVYEDAIVSSKAWIFDNAEVFGKAFVTGEAFIYHHAKVFDDAEVFDHARIYNSAQVFGEAIVHGNARIKGTMKASKPVTVIDNSEVVITITDDKVHIYQSAIYEKDNSPRKYDRIINSLKSIED